jgi:undecaprenyl-diphosphatase
METDVGLPDAASHAAPPRQVHMPRKHVVTPTPWSRRFGERRKGHPVRAASLIGIAGYVVLTIVLLAFGYLVTETAGIVRWDETVNDTVARARLDALTSLAQIGSYMGETLVVIAIAVTAALVMAARRLWAGIGLLAAGLLIEVSSFLTTSFVIGRPRPNVNPLDPAPPTGSYPSGHTAAAIVLYGTLAAIVIARTRSPVVRAVAWVLAITLPAWVGVSRLVLGMHHPTDEMGSVIGAFGCMAFALIATQVAVAAARLDADVQVER